MRTQSEYHSAVSGAQPGDVIILASGVWHDFEIVFSGNGEPQSPITLRAETPGEVVLSGESNLQLAGQHLLVTGLVFRDGYSPSGSVISFRIGKENLANHSRVSEVVIDRFNKRDRQDPDYWVAMYGRHNRFDHNHLQGKTNKGVTMAVRLDSAKSLQNQHRIDHNYFGPRPVFGSNGGETLRIGTSHYSREMSQTIVEDNYFERCDGEVEIVSNKSGGNVFRRNVFYESRGTLTLRHGNDNLVEDNIFIGNGVDHTGGIRVINRRQTVRNNYMEGLKGYRFGGALVVMNGVPNGPINRYDPVEDSIIEHNSLIDSDHIQLAAGSDAERSATPQRTTFTRNLIYHRDHRDTFTVYDDVRGITFEGNRINGVEDPVLTDGFANEAFEVRRAANGLYYATDPTLAEVGVAKTLQALNRDATGVDWYPKPQFGERFGSGETIKVSPGNNALSSAIAHAAEGDTLELSAGEYFESKVLAVDRAITIRAPQGAWIEYERPTLFEIQDGGSLWLDGVTVSGRSAPDYAGNSVIRTSRYGLLTNYEIRVDGSEFRDLNVNRSFHFLNANKSSLADHIQINDSEFQAISGSVLKLDRENDGLGIYSAEYVTIRDSKFEDIQGPLVSLARYGRDESTFGPHLTLTGSELRRVGTGQRSEVKASVYIHGVQVSTIADSRFEDSAPIAVEHTVGEPVTLIQNNTFQRTPEPTAVELVTGGPPTVSLRGNSYVAGEQ
ncbi:polysaccharide lyase 6 family protein [Congregibacter variabilis]|uniref:Polysaccharide lyase 6 family protein n=1 Tax=Congregibacter variabilis TaxID=3081200 RepID=A0ABZ0I0B7_9GAMM|nr:polysaccharide lyase 6 family protein [Congregibacter sp. IMCC43200]